MKKHAWLLMVPVFLAGVYTSSVDASWLSKRLEKLDKISQSTITTDSNGTMTYPAQTNRWVKIAENKYYTTYADSRNLKAYGTAQNREVDGYFKRVYTPIGSQALGNGSDGRVKPDVITYCIYKREFYVHSFSNVKSAYYYDVHNNLIYEGALEDFPHPYGGNYIPDSETEQLKDTLFRMFGWDY